MAPRAAETSPRVFLLHGPEQRLKEGCLETLIGERISPEDRELDVEWLDASTPGFAPERALEAAQDRGMFSGQRVVIIRHAEQLRDRRHERARYAMAQALARLPETTTLVFVTGAEGEAPGREGALGGELTEAVKRLGEARAFPFLPAEELAARARDYAASAEKDLRPGAATLLAQRAGPTLARVLLETEKLVCRVGEARQIAEAEVLELVPAPIEESIFTLLNQAALGNRRQAIASLGRLLESGEPPARILTMFARTLRQLLQARFLRERGVSPQARREDLPELIREQLPAEGDLYSTASQPWQRGRLWEQAARFSWKELRAAVDALAIVDAGSKGWEEGPQDPAIALELFVTRLCERSC